MTNQHQSHNEVTTIILKSSDHAKEFDYKNLVYRNELYKIFELVARALKLVKDEPNKKYLHNTITLLGSRGSGKTSFLLSVKNLIEGKGNHAYADIDLSVIQVLEIIDPTLIEEKGHVFLNVISLIADLVEKKLDKNECSPANDKASIITRKEWRSSLNKLAAGLPSIDGIGSHNADSWQDPEFVMDIGLKSVAAAQKLFDNFNEFLERSLSILNKEIFLLIFDDIDVDASKGWAVLETIRKYFTSSRLITIMSGDLELYTTVVRQKKWQNFGEEILKYEGTHAYAGNGLNEFQKQVTKLTAQYMLKIMQPQYRIRLNTLLHRKIINKDLGINIVFDDKNQDAKIYELELLYEKIFSHFGILNKVQVEVFSTFLLDQPLRSQIQFLLVLADISENKNNEFDNNILADIFLSDLLEQKVDISIAANTPKYLVSVILNLLLHKRNLEDLYQLQPTTTDDSFNATLFTLNFLLVNTIRNENRFVIFDYLFKIGYLRNLMTIVPYRKEGQSNTLQPSIEDLCERAGLFNDNIFRDSIGKVQSYLYGVLDLEGTVNVINPYFIQLRALQSTVKRSHTDRIDAVFLEANRAEKILGYMPCFSASFSYKNESRIGYSVYLLLAAIGEIVKQYETVLRNERENTRISLLKQLLKELSQLRSYPVVGFTKRQTDNIPAEQLEAVDDLEEYEYPEDRSEDHLASSILLWLESGKSIATASHLLGKISTRFFYAMNNIVESSTKGIALNVLFHRQIIAFLNAVLIEDARESLEGASFRLNINNTNADDRLLINNLKAVVDTKNYRYHNLNFSKWMLSCPLLLMYLNNESIPLFNMIHRYSAGEYIRHENITFSVYNLLGQVAIRLIKEANSFYNVVSGTPDLLKDPNALVTLLQEYSIPYEWFVDGKNQGETARRNKLIREYVSSIFLNDNRTATRIRDFRNILKEMGITW